MLLPTNIATALAAQVARDRRGTATHRVGIQISRPRPLAALRAHRAERRAAVCTAC